MDEPTCLFCKSTFSVPFGLEPTELCNMCAQELSARVLDACVTSWVPTGGKTPKELLHALMMWEQQIALDPAVSEAARKLQTDERTKIVVWLRHGVHNLGWHSEYLAIADSIESGEYEEKS